MMQRSFLLLACGAVEWAGLMAGEITVLQFGFFSKTAWKSQYVKSDDRSRLSALIF